MSTATHPKLSSLRTWQRPHRDTQTVIRSEQTMKRFSAILLAGVAAFAVIATLAGPVPSAAGEMTTTVGGAPMYPSKNIVQNAVNS